MALLEASKTPEILVVASMRGCVCVCIIQLSATDLYENEDLIKPFGPTRDFSDNRQLGNTAVG